MSQIKGEKRIIRRETMFIKEGFKCTGIIRMRNTFKD